MSSKAIKKALNYYTDGYIHDIKLVVSVRNSHKLHLPELLYASYHIRIRPYGESLLPYNNITTKIRFNL